MCALKPAQHTSGVQGGTTLHQHLRCAFGGKRELGSTDLARRAAQLHPEDHQREVAAARCPSPRCGDRGAQEPVQKAARVKLWSRCPIGCLPGCAPGLAVLPDMWPRRKADAPVSAPGALPQAGALPLAVEAEEVSAVASNLASREVAAIDTEITHAALADTGNDGPGESKAAFAEAAALQDALAFTDTLLAMRRGEAQDARPGESPLREGQAVQPSHADGTWTSAEVAKVADLFVVEQGP